MICFRCHRHFEEVRDNLFFPYISNSFVLQDAKIFFTSFSFFFFIELHDIFSVSARLSTTTRKQILQKGVLNKQECFHDCVHPPRFTTVPLLLPFSPPQSLAETKQELLKASAAAGEAADDAQQLRLHVEAVEGEVCCVCACMCGFPPRRCG